MSTFDSFAHPLHCYNLDSLDFAFAISVSDADGSLNNENVVVPLGNVKLELLSPIDEPILMAFPFEPFIFIL